MPSTTIAEPRPSQAQEKQLPALIASQGLHGRIIDELQRAPERLSKVKPDPPGREIMRFCNRPVPENRPRVAYRHDVILPFRRELLDSGDHVFGRQGRPGGKLPRFGLSGGEDFDMRPAYINNQHVQMGSLRHSSSPARF